MSNKPKKSVKDTELNTDLTEERASVSENKVDTIKSTDSDNIVDTSDSLESQNNISNDERKDSDTDKDDPNSIVSSSPIELDEFSNVDSSPTTNANVADENSEPIIIIGGASEVVFEPEIDDETNDENELTVKDEEPKVKEKSLRIIEGGGKEIIIDDSSKVIEKLSDTPACTRNKVKDKKIGDYGTYIAIAFFVITIIISIFNIKGMRYPLSCLFLSLAALTMGVTTVLRLLNNKKCDCTTCKTQNKTFVYSAVLWFAVFVGAMIAFLVLFLK